MAILLCHNPPPAAPAPQQGEPGQGIRGSGGGAAEASPPETLLSLSLESPQDCPHPPLHPSSSPSKGGAVLAPLLAPPATVQEAAKAAGEGALAAGAPARPAAPEGGQQHPHPAWHDSPGREARASSQVPPAPLRRGRPPPSGSLSHSGAPTRPAKHAALGLGGGRTDGRTNGRGAAASSPGRCSLPPLAPLLC